MKDEKTTIIKGTKLTYNGDDWNAWDRVQEETTEEERGQMSLQDFLIALDNAGKKEAQEQAGEHRSD